YTFGEVFKLGVARDSLPLRSGSPAKGRPGPPQFSPRMGSRLCLHIPESCSGLNSATDCRTAGRSWWQQPEKGVRSRSGIPATGGRSLAAERWCQSAQEKVRAMAAHEDTVQ